LDLVRPSQDSVHRERPPVPLGGGRPDAAAAGDAGPHKRRRVGAAAGRPALTARDGGDGSSEDDSVDDGPVPLSLSQSQASTGSAGASDGGGLDIRPLAQSKRRSRAAGETSGRSSRPAAAAPSSAARPPRRLQEMDMANLMRAFRERFPPPKSHLESLGSGFAVRVGWDVHVVLRRVCAVEICGGAKRERGVGHAGQLVESVCARCGWVAAVMLTWCPLSTCTCVFPLRRSYAFFGSLLFAHPTWWF